MLDADNDKVHQVIQPHQAAAVVNRPQWKRQAPRDGAHQRLKTRCDAGPVYQWRPDDHHFQAGLVGNALQTDLRLVLAYTIRILRHSCSRFLKESAFTVRLDGTEMHE